MTSMTFKSLFLAVREWHHEELANPNIEKTARLRAVNEETDILATLKPASMFTAFVYVAEV